MSKTVRFKLSGKEETYVFSTIHNMKRMRLLPESTSLSEFSRQALIQALINLNELVSKRIQEEKESASTGVDTSEEVTGAATDEDGETDSTDTEEESEGTSAT